MTNNTDDIITITAEAHRVEHSHTVYVLPGRGWVCEVCDADYEEVIEEYLNTEVPFSTKDDCEFCDLGDTDHSHID